MKKLLVAAFVALSTLAGTAEEAAASDGRVRGMLRRTVQRDTYRTSRSGNLGSAVRRGAGRTINLGEDAVILYLDLHPVARVLQGKSPWPL